MSNDPSSNDRNLDGSLPREAGDAEPLATAPYGNSALGRARQLLDEVPAQIGPYRVLERIGQGGMGDVLRAEQREPIRREVALKLVKLGMDTKLVLARFEAERQALALMDHPHIAKVFEASADQSGRPYFVMEYVRGKPITEYADQNHLSIPERLDLFCQVCNAIQHAHHKGIIHRDIKPSNVLVSTQDGKPFAKVIDFGIAKATATQLTDKTLYTLHDQFIGTPQYMSPEQAEGSADIDTRTDVYSLGVLLYELLTGSTPFGGAELRDAALDQVKRIIRESEPPKPSTRLSQSGSTLPALAAARRTEPAKLGTIVRGELDWIAMSALEKDRRRRYDTPNSFADDIQRYLSGEPVEAAPPSRVYQLTKFAQRYRWPLTAAATLLLLLTVFAGVVSGLAVQLKRNALIAQEKQAEAEAARTESDEQRESAETQAYINTLAAAQSAMAANNWPEARRRLDSAPNEYRGWEWNFLRRKATAPLVGFPQSVYEAKMTPDASQALLSDEGVFTLVDLGSQSVIANYRGRPFNGSEDYLWSTLFAIAPGGDLVAVQFEKELVVSRGPKEVCRVDCRLLKKKPTEVTFTKSGQRLLVTSADQNGVGELGVFDARTGGVIGLHETGGGYFGIEGSCNEHHAVLPNRVGAARITALSGGEVGELSLHDKRAQTRRVQLSSDGGMVAIASNTDEAGVVELFSVPQGKQLDQFAFDERTLIEDVAISPDGKTIAAVSSEGRWQVWDIATKALLAQCIRPALRPVFTADGNRLVGFQDGCVWSWRHGDTPTAWRDPAGEAEVVQFSLDGSRCLSLDDRRIRLWETGTRVMQPISSTITWSEEDDRYQHLTLGPLSCPLSNWSDAVRDAALVFAERNGDIEFTAHEVQSARGRWRAEASGDGSCEIKSKDGERRLKLSGLPVAMATPSDGSRLIVAGQDGAVRFYDTSRWSEFAAVQLAAPITGMALSLDGTRLVVTTADNAIEVWDTRTATEREAADAVYSAAMNSANASTAARNPDLNGLLLEKQLSAIDRVATVSAFKQELDKDIAIALSTLAELRRDHVFKESVTQAAASLSLTTNQQQLLKKELDQWEETEEERHLELPSIADNPKSSPELVKAAMKIAEEQLEESPAKIGNRLRVAELGYRLGDYERTIKLITERNQWVTDEDRVTVWNAHFRNLCYLAMAEHHLGNRKNAVGFLHAAMRYWPGSNYAFDPYRPLQEEAANLIYPDALKAMEWPASDAFKAADAIDAADTEQLKAFVGEDVTVKGRVVRVSPNARGTGANLIFSPADRGLLAFAWIDQQSAISWSSLRSFEGKEVQVTGVLKIMEPRVGLSYWVFGRPEIEIESLDQIEVIGDGNDEVAWWNVAARQIEQADESDRPTSKGAEEVVP
jgi:serine/threonine protein kinase/WD40 repeat protein